MLGASPVQRAGWAGAGAPLPCLLASGRHTPRWRRAQVARMGGAGVPFPFLCLLVSGGHNMLAVAEGVGRYELLGATLDDAVGARAGCARGGRAQALLGVADGRSGAVGQCPLGVCGGCGCGSGARQGMAWGTPGMA